MRDLIADSELARGLLKAAYRASSSWTAAGFLAPRRDLLYSNFTAKAEIEFTTRCNLRCVYCHSVVPGHKGADLDLAHLDHVVDVLKMRGALAIGVSGSGETTIINGWQSHCNRILDRGIDLFITTNLARELRDEEALTLARLLVIQVSVDTADPDLFRMLRRGGDLKTVVYNLAKIRSLALRHGLRGPVIWWNAVVNSRTVWGLKDYVTFGLAQGVKHFNFLSMYEHQAPDDSLKLLPLARLPRENLSSVPPLMESVFRMIRRGKASYACSTVLDEVRCGLATKSDDTDGHVRSGPPSEAGGLTRDCLDPWIYIKVACDSSVRPCCAGADIVGVLNSGDNLSHVVNNSRIREFRESLLTGKLEPVCRRCKLKGWTSLEALRLKVSLISAARRISTALHSRNLLVPLIHAWRR
jgi:MoaA/NifB/PqqE/SkfB family radical SAM enzyme